MLVRRLLLAFSCLMSAILVVGSSPAHASPVSLDSLLSAKDWLNAKATPQLVRGKVVLLDFYTFECINCKHVQANLRALYRSKARTDFVIVSVHSPETDAEKDRSNLVASMRDQGVTWPVAVDNDFNIWNAYGVQAWPTQMIFDRRGHLRKTVVGDSQDAIVNASVAQLLGEK